jgi:hypothetical protein
MNPSEALESSYPAFEDGWMFLADCLWSTLSANEAVGTGYIVGDCNYAPVWAHRYVEHWTDVELSCSAIRRAEQSARIFFGAF